MIVIFESILAGAIVGLINKYIFNSSSVLYETCKPDIDEEISTSSSITVSTDLSVPHVHI